MLIKNEGHSAHQNEVNRQPAENERLTRPIRKIEQGLGYLIGLSFCLNSKFTFYPSLMT